MGIRFRLSDFELMETGRRATEGGSIKKSGVAGGWVAAGWPQRRKLFGVGKRAALLCPSQLPDKKTASGAKFKAHEHVEDNRLPESNSL